MEALPKFEESDAFSDLDKLALRYALAMTATPVHVPDDLFAALEQHFNHEQLVELTSCIAWENYRARFNRALAIESDGFSDGRLFHPSRRPANRSRRLATAAVFQAICACGASFGL